MDDESWVHVCESSQCMSHPVTQWCKGGSDSAHALHLLGLCPRETDLWSLLTNLVERWLERERTLDPCAQAHCAEEHQSMICAYFKSFIFALMRIDAFIVWKFECVLHVFVLKFIFVWAFIPGSRAEWSFGPTMLCSAYIYAEHSMRHICRIESVTKLEPYAEFDDNLDVWRVNSDLQGFPALIMMPESKLGMLSSWQITWSGCQGSFRNLKYWKPASMIVCPGHVSRKRHPITYYYWLLDFWCRLLLPKMALNYFLV